MTKEDVLLTILAAAGGRPYSPVQIQKATFLVTMNLPRLVSRGLNYNFQAYDYGPFDLGVYESVELLSTRGLAEIGRSQGAKWKTYAATDKGLASGNSFLESMSEQRSNYIRSVSKWVRNQSFESLVKAIYDRYPEMRSNSIFQG